MPPGPVFLLFFTGGLRNRWCRPKTGAILELLSRKLVEKAKQGDVYAVRLCVERIWGPQGPQERTDRVTWTCYLPVLSGAAVENARLTELGANLGNEGSPPLTLMVAIARLHIWDKLQHFGAYLALSLLPVIGFRDRRRGLMASLSMFLLGVLMEAGQHFSPGRSMDLGDVIANGVGVSCGTLLGLPIRALMAIV